MHFHIVWGQLHTPQGYVWGMLGILCTLLLFPFSYECTHRCSSRPCPKHCSCTSPARHSCQEKKWCAAASCAAWTQWWFWVLLQLYSSECLVVEVLAVVFEQALLAELEPICWTAIHSTITFKFCWRRLPTCMQKLGFTTFRQKSSRKICTHSGVRTQLTRTIIS